MTKKQLEAKAQEYFKLEEDQERIFATSDGTFFWPQNKGDAQTHARRNELDLFEISRKKSKAEVKAAKEAEAQAAAEAKAAKEAEAQAAAEAKAAEEAEAQAAAAKAAEEAEAKQVKIPEIPADPAKARKGGSSSSQKK